MKVDDIIIVTNLGEMKVYKANPRDLEAEAGLKPHNVKLDLINSFDYIESHQKIKDIVSDEAGRFKADAGKMGGNISPENKLEEKLEEDVINQIAEDIFKLIQELNPPRYYLALPETIYNRVIDKLKSLSAKDANITKKLFKVLKEDYVKTDKNKIIELFKEKGEVVKL